VRARVTRAAIVVAALVFPLALLTACGQAAGARTAPARVTMAFCGGRPQPRPTVVEVICTTNDITARSLVWAGWGKPVATARGTAVVDLCSFADCHTSKYSNFPIVGSSPAPPSAPSDRQPQLLMVAVVAAGSRARSAIYSGDGFRGSLAQVMPSAGCTITASSS
jgi:hypothetical protein